MENPTNFNNKIDVFQNYNKAPHRIIPSTGQATVNPGDTTIFTMPIKTIDWDTFRLDFDAKTAGTNTEIQGFPQFMPCMIDQLDIYVNGINVQHIPYYGTVFKIMKDYSVSFDDALKKVGNNADPSVVMSMTDAGVLEKKNRYTSTGETALNRCEGKYSIDEWVGFISSCAPRIWNTNMVGTIELHIKWAPVSVLWGTSAAGAYNYEISNLYAYVDVIDWKDASYYDGIEAKLTSEGGFKIPYKNYRVHLGNSLTNTKQSTTRFTESTQSLDKIIFTYLHGARNTNARLQLGTPDNTAPVKILPTEAANDGSDAATTQALANALKTKYNANVVGGYVAPSNFCYETLKSIEDPYLLNTSQYFRRNGLGMAGGSVQFEINSQDVPSFPLTLLGQYEETLKAFELNDKDLKLINPGIRDINRYERDFYCCALSTSHINDKRDVSLISGKDTQATSMSLCVKATQGRATNNAQAAQPCVITEMSAILMIGSGRECSVIF